MTALRTRLALAIAEAGASNTVLNPRLVDAVLAELGSLTDADVERVARAIVGQHYETAEVVARAAIRALVGEAGG